MVTKIEIKTVFGDLLFSFEKEDNNINDTIEEAVKGGANLRGADLGGANLRGADLRGADMRGADLRGAKDVPFIPLACPSDGSFIGWKKVRVNLSNDFRLVKLEIPEDARRSSATSNKCRCDKAKVLAITNLEEKETFSKVTNNEYAPCTYKVGEFVYPDSFEEDRWNECSHGIHFFTNRQEAINYNI